MLTALSLSIASCVVPTFTTRPGGEQTRASTARRRVASSSIPIRMRVESVWARRSVELGRRDVASTGRVFALGAASRASRLVLLRFAVALGVATATDVAIGIGFAGWIAGPLLRTLATPAADE